MSNIKKILLQLLEYILIAAVIFYWISSSAIINPIAIVLIIGLILQMIFKNKTIGLFIPSIIILASLYMLMALLSELREFSTFNYDAKKLLFVGLAFFISSIFISGLMIYKYAIIKNSKLAI